MRKIRILLCFIVISSLLTACASTGKNVAIDNSSKDIAAEVVSTAGEEQVAGKTDDANTDETEADVTKAEEAKADETGAGVTKTDEAALGQGEQEQEAEVIQFDLDEYDRERMEKADGWSNGSIFDCTWRGANISFQDGIMTLKIDSDGQNASPKWSGGEYRTRDFYHYGMYEVRMKPIKNDGVVSSFFVYTGPSDNNPWDEVDIEFLGKDTTKIQFNYFTNGVGEHEFIYDLGFDASEDFHTYGFQWLQDSITWYVDGVEVHKATENIPSTPGKIMMNVWPGIGVDGWLNPFDGKVPLEAQYDWFRYSK